MLALGGRTSERQITLTLLGIRATRANGRVLLPEPLNK
jgi:hypothetical protein